MKTIRSWNILTVWFWRGERDGLGGAYRLVDGTHVEVAADDVVSVLILEQRCSTVQ